MEQQQKRKSLGNSAIGSVKATTSSPSSPSRKSLTDRFSQSFSLPADSSPERSLDGKSKSFDSSFSPQIQSMMRKSSSVSPMMSPSDDKSRRLSMAITSASSKTKRKSGSSFITPSVSFRGIGSSSKSRSWDNYDDDDDDNDEEAEAEEKHSKFCMCGCRGTT